LASAVRGLAGTACGLVAVAYADAATRALSPLAVIEVAARVGARGVLIDTMDKQGPGLFGVMPASDLARWVSAGRAAGLLVAVAGQVTARDLAGIAEAGADVAGVRGAACVGGRGGRVSADLVRGLVTGLAAPAHAAPR
jgi:hypothetical protein